MRAVWSDEHKYELWLRIEVLACEAWASLGRIPESALPKIRKGTLDATKIAEVESRVGHDVIAFLTVLNESIGQPEARYVHIGMTSQDLNDTALAVQMVESARLITGDLAGVREAAADLALKHRKTLMAGRTHGIVAEPTTFGFKVAGWVAELDRSIERLEQAADEAAVGRVSGAVGTHATIDPRVEEHVCRELGLKVDEVTTQVVSRDRHASFMSAVAIAAGTLERIATEIRLLQRTEVGEVFEPFGKEQKGSSAMPHKRNPVLTERVCGLARVVRGNLLTALENTALWHERDISHSSAERVAFPDATILLDYAQHLAIRVVRGMTVHADRMRANLDATHGALYSQRALLALVERDRSRDDGYRIVQAAAQRAWDTGTPFRELLAEAAPELDLDAVFDPEAFVRHAGEIVDRLDALGDESSPKPRVETA